MPLDDGAGLPPSIQDAIAVWRDADGSEHLQADEVPSASDSAFGRIRWGWPGAGRTLNARLRRLQGWELLLVLALFPLGSAYQGIVDLIERVQSGVPVASHDIPPVNGSWLPVLLAIIRQLPVLAVAALVCYLLSRSGEGLRAINLGRTRIRTDLALLLAVFVVVQWIPQWFGAHLLAWTHTQGFFLLPSPVPLSRSALTVAQVAFSLTAGIVEEVVVLGYLVRRLEQRGFNVIAVVAIDVAVRISYHLYYGWNVIPIALWALVSVLIYLRVRRLLPFILCHVAWDAAIPFRAFYPGTYTTMWLVALTITLVLMLAWGTWSPDTSEERFPRVT